MQEQSEQHCWQKRKAREEDNEKIKRNKESRDSDSLFLIFYIKLYEFRLSIWYPLRKLTLWRDLRGYEKLTEALENDLQ